MVVRMLDLEYAPEIRSHDGRPGRTGNWLRSMLLTGHSHVALFFAKWLTQMLRVLFQGRITLFYRETVLYHFHGKEENIKVCFRIELDIVVP